MASLSLSSPARASSSGSGANGGSGGGAASEPPRGARSLRPAPSMTDKGQQYRDGRAAHAARSDARAARARGGARDVAARVPSTAADSVRACGARSGARGGAVGGAHDSARDDGPADSASGDGRVSVARGSSASAGRPVVAAREVERAARCASRGARRAIPELVSRPGSLGWVKDAPAREARKRNALRAIRPFVRRLHAYIAATSARERAALRRRSGGGGAGGGAASHRRRVDLARAGAAGDGDAGLAAEVVAVAAGPGAAEPPLSQDALRASARWVLDLNVLLVGLSSRSVARAWPAASAGLIRRCYELCDRMMEWSSTARVGADHVALVDLGFSPVEISELGHRLILMLPQLLLSVTARHGASRGRASAPENGRGGRVQRERARKTNWRCRAFLRGDFRALFESLEGSASRVRATGPKGSSRKQADRATRLARTGELRRAAQTLGALAPLPHDDAVLGQLEGKFPCGEEPDLAELLVDLPGDVLSLLETWEERLGEHDPDAEGNHLRAFQTHVINNLARESGTGPSRLAFEHVQALCDVDVELAWRHVRRILRGRVPVSLRPIFAAARLHALRKKEGSSDARPISVGEVWRRVAGKVAMLVVREKAAAVLRGVGQWGVGVKGGTEAAVHAVRLALTQLSPLSVGDPEIEARVNGEGEPLHFNLAIGTDISNAFGEIHRAPIFQVVREEFPELFEVMRVLYGQDTYLFFKLDTPGAEDELHAGLQSPESDADVGEVAMAALSEIRREYRWVLCRRGVHQGCPFGSLAFCLGVLAVVRRVLAKHPAVRIPSIADDMTLTGPQWDCAAAFLDLKFELSTVGCQVAPKKCKAFCSGGHMHPMIRRLLEDAGELSEANGCFPADGFVLCGAPVGPEPEWDVTSENRFEADEVLRAVEKRAPVVARVAQLRDPTAKYLLSRYCISTRYNHQVRTVDPVSVERGAALHDAQVEDLLASCLGVDLGDAAVSRAAEWSLRQTKLPLRFGGCGCVTAIQVRHAAYYGSCVQAYPLVRELYEDVGVAGAQPEHDVCLGSKSVDGDSEARLLALFAGELPKRYISEYTQFGTWFDALQLALGSVDEGDLPAELRADIPTPLLHCVDARRRVLAIADKHNITTGLFKPFSPEPEPVLPALDFSTPQLKAQKLASDIIKRSEFLSLRSAAEAAGLRDVVARLDDCRSMGAGAFLDAIPGGRDRSGRFQMQGDHWRVAARCHVGLPPEGVIPATKCALCDRRWDHGVFAPGCSMGRAAIHPSVCTKGQLKNRRHDAAADVLLEMYESLGGTGAVDHKKQLNVAGTATLGSVCALESGARVDVILYGAGRSEEDIAIDVSFVCAEASTRGFKAAIKDREQLKNDTYKEECEKAGLLFFPFVLGAHGGFGEEAKKVWALLKRHADKVKGRNFRHSWSAMSFSSCWMQKLSIAIAKETAMGALRRTAICTRQRAMGEADESADGGYESFNSGRAPAM